MKQYEYKKLQDRPLIAPANATDFENWMVKTLNGWGAQGWRAVQVSTPMVNNQLTGDLIVLGERELPIDPDVKALLEKKAADGRFPRTV